MRRKIAVGIVALALAGGVGFAAPAGAAKPAEKACIGELFGGEARTNGGPVPGAGGIVSFFAVERPFDLSFGEGIQALQAGEVPDEVQPNPCNED